MGLPAETKISTNETDATTNPAVRGKRVRTGTPDVRVVDVVHPLQAWPQPLSTGRGPGVPGLSAAGGQLSAAAGCGHDSGDRGRSSGGSPVVAVSGGLVGGLV